MTPYKAIAWLRALGRPAAALPDLWDSLAHLYRGRTYLHLEAPLALAGPPVDTLTYNDTRARVARIAGALRDLGVRTGDRVALWGDNRPDYALSLFAALRLGAVAIPLHHELTAAEAGERVRVSGARFVVLDGDRRLDDLGEVRPLALDDGALARAASIAAEAAPARVDPDATAAILYTSGTTGMPKGAVLTGASLLSLTPLFRLVPNPTDEVGVYALPTAHMMALSVLIYAAAAGSALHWRRAFDAGEILDLLELGRPRPTFFVGVPAMYGKLLAAGAERRDLTSVRAWVSSADRVPPEWVERFCLAGCALPTPGGERLLGAAFVQMFGMVELSGAALAEVTFPPFLPPAGSVPRGDEAGLTRIAWPIPPYRAAILDNHGQPLPAGGVGELWLRGPGVTRGYEGDPEATAAAISRGWLRTGDLARRGRFGSLEVVGRAKDVVKHGGYSVFPSEVEAKLLRHPGLVEAVVLGAPHPIKAEIPVAVLVPGPGVELDPRAVHAWCREHIAPYQAPRAVYLTSAAAIPRNANGKVLKRELLEVTLHAMRSTFPEAFEAR